MSQQTVAPPPVWTELRVHGIGGPSAEGILGCPATATSWRSEPHARSSMQHCAGDYRVHAYLWSPLTSGSRAFALWPLLLPFTLVNVAGWMAPRGARRATVHRFAAVVIGLTTTMAATLWFLLAALALWGRVDADELPLLPGEPPTKLFTAAAASAAVALGLLVLSATFAARGYDRFRPPTWTEPPRPWRWPWGSGLRARLGDERFYDNAVEHTVRWRIHTATAAATWLAVVGIVFRVKEPQDAGHVLGRSLIVVSVIQAVSIALMTFVALPSDGPDRRLGRRLLGPAAATVGIMLLGGLVLSGVISLVGIKAMPRGPAVVLYDLYGWAMLAALACAVACVVNALMQPTSAEQGVARRFLASTMARLRARLATVLLTIDLVVVALALAFAIAGAAALAVRWSDMLDDKWTLTESLPVTIAKSTFALVIGFLVLNLWKSKASPAALRNIGNLWDILTFWPRAFHPFAVRPYAERAVPELQHILRVAPRNGPLVVTAHSQGTVLLFAAVRPFVEQKPTGPRCSLPPFALVTFGSPLRALHAAVFPHYFDAAEIDETRAAIAGGWTNHFRLTDHVGRAVFATDSHVLAAPTTGSLDSDQPIVDGHGAVHGHNDYWAEPDIRLAVARAANRLQEQR